MDLERNKFREVMSGGNPSHGLFVGLPGNSNAEIIASAGFDWLLIDHEHAPFELGDILHYLQAIAPYDVAPIVRPVDHNPALLKKLLDIGVQTFLLPMVDDAEQAQAIVRALRYPPDGIRGLGTSLARAAAWGQVPDYVHKANAEICLIVQVETVKALHGLPEILSVEGVDGVFIGPSDLSASMGHVGNPGHPEVVAAVNSALETVSSAGKYAGVLCLDLELADAYRASGADFIGVGVDTLLLGHGARRLAQLVKAVSDNEEDSSPGY